MSGDKLINLQMQIKQNNEEMRNYINDLNSWENEIKAKENLLKSDKHATKHFPPVRSQTEKKSEIRDAKVANSTKRIKSWDYKAWEKFDADKACEEADSSDEEEEIEDEVEHKVNSLREQGNKFFKQGKHNDALGCYTQALLLDPCNSILLSNRAMAYIKLDKYALAENDCTKAIEFDPECVKAYMRRGKARQSLKKYEEARNDYREALMLEPNNKFCKECLQELTKIVETKNMNGQGDTKFKEKGVVMPITKTLSKRSKKPLQRIVVEEIGLDSPTISNHNNSESYEDQSFQKFLSGTEKVMERKLEEKGITNVEITSINSGPNSCATNETLSPNLAPPSNSYQFQVDWALLKNKDAEFFYYFKAIDPNSYRQIFGEALDSDILSKIISVLCQHYSEIDVYFVLKQLSNVKRFAMNVGFLSSDDKQKLETIFEKMLKEKIKEDVRMLKSLYK